MQIAAEIPQRAAQSIHRGSLLEPAIRPRTGLRAHEECGDDFVIEVLDVDGAASGLEPAIKEEAVATVLQEGMSGSAVGFELDEESAQGVVELHLGVRLPERWYAIRGAVSVTASPWPRESEGIAAGGDQKGFRSRAAA